MHKKRKVCARPGCGKLFLPKAKSSRFCSKSCCNKHHSSAAERSLRLSEPVEKRCKRKGCKNKFLARKRSDKYCCKKCCDLDHWEKNRADLTRVCAREGCGVIFTPKKRFGIYCSKKCGDAVRNKLHYEKVVAERNKRRSVCEVCGDPFEPKRFGEGKRYGRVCPKCMPEYRRQWLILRNRENRRIRKGLCAYCDNPLTPGQRVCRQHSVDKARPFGWDYEKESIFNHFAVFLDGKA